MKPKELVIATALILLFSAVVSGCQVVEPSSTGKAARKTIIEEFVMKAVAAKKEVRLSLKAVREGAQVRVTVNLENPNLKPITSTQAWLSFDPALLQGKSINVKDSAFSLMAPYDNAFDNETGLAMLGRANPKPLTDKTIKVAELVFDSAKDGTAMVDAYDYQDDLSGHTSANVLVNGKPFNILLKPTSPLLIIE